MTSAPFVRTAAEQAIAPYATQERDIYVRALTATRGSVVRAARILGVGRATIYRRTEALGIDVHKIRFETRQSERTEDATEARAEPPSPIPAPEGVP